MRLVPSVRGILPSLVFLIAACSPTGKDRGVPPEIHIHSPTSLGPFAPTDSLDLKITALDPTGAQQMAMEVALGDSLVWLGYGPARLRCSERVGLAGHWDPHHPEVVLRIQAWTRHSQSILRRSLPLELPPETVESAPLLLN